METTIRSATAVMTLAGAAVKPAFHQGDMLVLSQRGEKMPTTLPKIVRTEGLARVLLLVFVPAIVGLLVLAAISVGSGITISTFVRESKASVEYPFVGLLSDIGILIWTAAASICLFTSLVLRKWKSDRLVADFLLYSGVLTTLLMLDDFFLIHETVALRDRYLFLAYLLGVVFIMVRFRKLIQHSAYELLFVSLFFFGLSLFVDVGQNRVEEVIGDWRILVEDGFKFLGIVGWFAYFARYCFRALSPASSERP